MSESKAPDVCEQCGGNALVFFTKDDPGCLAAWTPTAPENYRRVPWLPEPMKDRIALAMAICKNHAEGENDDLASAVVELLSDLLAAVEQKP